jgi:FtsP/CotA-like multicopper oxidase with cupredoxin domain
MVVMMQKSSILLPILLTVIFAGAAEAQRSVTAQACTPCPLDQELIEPPVIQSANGVLDTTLRVELKPQSVPVWQQTTSGWSCCMQTLNLRTYGSPKPDGTFQYGFPGPTLKLRKAEAPGGQGDRLRIKLVNALPVESGSDHECHGCGNCSGPTPPQCCRAQDVSPNCFHGDNITNLHFHGAHVSPQPPQDYVLLEVHPQGSEHLGHPTHAGGLAVAGEYQFDVDPLRWNQPEGTFWYHPHKHGAVALQVANGMAGTLMIEGPFDDWLRGYYKGQELKDRVLVVQQVNDKLNFFAGGSVPQILVNGQANPKIKMYPGEIQRWRFVGATMQASAQLEIDFNSPQSSPVQARQIAMDGIRFAPENYDRQPLLPQDTLRFRLSPGNRADFLVQAPVAPGAYDVTFDVFGATSGSEGAQAQRALLNFLAPAATEPRIVSIEVVPCDGCQPMAFPAASDWPAMPSYLADIPAPTADAAKRSLLFEIKDPAGNNAAPGAMPSKFYINFVPGEARQFNPACVDVTAKLGAAEEWTIQNTTDADPFHVFHIHTNAFQVVQNGTTPLTPPYVWQDSISLPASLPASPATGPANMVKIRTHFEDFTGQYVLHCHFLGHEDRGMMLGVQTVCPNGVDFGKPNPAGPECGPGRNRPAAPRCPTISGCSGAVPGISTCRAPG